jgi:hypothetical protein
MTFTGPVAFVLAFVSTAIIAKLKLPVEPTAPKLKSKDEIIKELEDRVDHLHLVNNALHEHIRLEQARFAAREGVLLAQRDLAAQQLRDVFLQAQADADLRGQRFPPPILTPPSKTETQQALLGAQSIREMLNYQIEDHGHIAFCTCVPARGDVLMPRRRAF